MSSSTEQEIRQEFARWFEEAAAKDIDAVMSHIAKDAHGRSIRGSWANRIMEAMLQMKKIDIAGLKKAYDQR